MTGPDERSQRPDYGTAYYTDSELGAKTYDQFYGNQHPGMLEFYLSCARTHGGPVLELGAGTGLVAWALAAEGHSVLGLDLSARMLAVARAKARHHSAETVARTEFVEGDMTDFRLQRSFALAMVPGRSFQHLMTPTGQRAALACIHGHLSDGGMLAMNLFDPDLEYCRPNAKPVVAASETVDEDTGHTLRRTFLARTTDPLSQTFSERMRLEVLDQAGTPVFDEETEWSLRWSYQQEMRHLFELCGFEVVQLHSDFQGSAPAYGKEQVWLCRKV